MATYIDERGDRVSEKNTSKKVEVTPVEARQGLPGRPVLIVLVAGLILAAVAWGLAETYGESTDNDAATDSKQVEPQNAPAASTQAPTIDNTLPAGQQMQTAPTDRDPTPENGTGGDTQSKTPDGTGK